MNQPRDARPHVTDRLDEYANDMLDAEEKAMIERHLDDCEHCRDELVWLRKLRQDLAALHPLREDIGLARFLARIRPNEAPARGHHEVALFGRASETRSRWRTLALAAGVVVVIAQAVVIGALWQGRGTGFQPLSGPTVRAQLQVTFKRNATADAMRRALVAVNGEIVGGPGVLGVYFVRVPPAHVAQAATTLQHDIAVESVDVVAQEGRRDGR